MACGIYFVYTSHFLGRREYAHPEATDECIIQVLENPEAVDFSGGNRRVYWGLIPEQDGAPWWLKVVTVDNSTGPAILSAYSPADAERLG